MSHQTKIEPLSNQTSPIIIQGFYILMGVGFITICSKTHLPFWPVPMTLQTLAIFLIAALYGTRLGVMTITSYLALGLAGLPVFSGIAAGPAYFVGPTAGFLLGFIILTAFVGITKDRGFMNGHIQRFLVFTIADSLCFLFGFIWLAYFFVLPSTGNSMGATAAFSAGVIPFILADILKIAIATLLIGPIRRFKEIVSSVQL